MMFCNYTSCCNEPTCCNFSLEDLCQTCAFKSSALQTPAVFPHMHLSEVKDRNIPLRAHDIHLLLTFNTHFLSLPFPAIVLKHICHLQSLLTGTFQGWNQCFCWTNNLKSRPFKTYSFNTDKGLKQELNWSWVPAIFTLYIFSIW